MAIEFTCDRCDAVLRTADANAALPATCPACGERLHVPTFGDEPAPIRSRGLGHRVPSSPRPVDGGRRPSLGSNGRPRNGTSPHEPAPADIVVCDHCGTRNVPGATVCRNCDEPLVADDARASFPAESVDDPARRSPVEQFGIDEVVSSTWDVFRREFGPCLLGYVVCGLGWGAGLVGGFIPVLLLFPLAAAGVIPRPVLPMIVVPFIGLVFLLITTYSQIGQMLYFEHVVRDGNGNLALLFRGSRFVLRMLVLNLLFAVMVGVGLLAFVIPGLVLYTMFWPASFILVEDDCGVFTALDRSRRLTEGHRGTLFLVSVLTLLIWGVGLAFAGMGSLATAPFSSLLAVVTYLHLTGRFYESDPEPWVEEYAADPIIGDDGEPAVDRLEPDPA